MQTTFSTIFGCFLFGIWNSDLCNGCHREWRHMTVNGSNKLTWSWIRWLHWNSRWLVFSIVIDIGWLCHTPYVSPHRSCVHTASRTQTVCRYTMNIRCFRKWWPFVCTWSTVTVFYRNEKLIKYCVNVYRSGLSNKFRNRFLFARNRNRISPSFSTPTKLKFSIFRLPFSASRNTCGGSIRAGAARDGGQTFIPPIDQSAMEFASRTHFTTSIERNMSILRRNQLNQATMN